ncbi:MAG: hypothetical protein ACHBNF_19365 [Chromatiales bacterium]
MNKATFFYSVIAVMTMMVGIVMPSSDARATGKKPVCYVLDAFPSERLKLDIKKHSPLSERKEEINFKHAKQTAYDVQGKHVGTCGFATMVTIDGTVVTAKGNRYTTGPTGAHLGLEGHSARAEDSCRSVTFDCTTKEVSATPSTWTCFIRNDFDSFFGESTLTKVDETKDELCSIFEDGFEDGIPELKATPSGPGSGQRQ